MRDIVNSIGFVQAIPPAVQTATVTGAVVDTLGFNAAAVLINTGAIVSSGNFTPKLRESSDGSIFTDVAASDLIGTLPSALAASSAIKIGYKGFKRYIQPVLTLNSGTSIAASATVVLGRASKKPVA